MAVPAPPLRAERSRPRKTHKATCAGCRRRRTRCDRLLPCSECKKRGVECDYTGAIPPSRSVRSCSNHLDEREQYIKQLEARLEALEQAKLASPSLNSTKDVPAVQIDFSSDDLASHLSRLTLGPRLQHRPLEGQLEALFSNWTSQPASAVFLPHNAFQMSIIPTNPPPPLDALQACLPPLPELAELASCYFENSNTTVPFVCALERSAWPDAVARCYKPSDVHQFTPEDFHRLAAVFCVAAHGAIQKAVLATPNSQCPRAHKWFHIALGVLTQPDRGAILTQTTIWSIRAMALLAQVPLAPENLDQGIIFWTLLTHLARSVDLFNEPPELHAEQVGDVELESRRNLAWSILQLDVTGETIAGATWKPMDFEFHGLLLPGTANCKIDPNDGWPVDLVLAVCRALALMNRVTSELITKILGGRMVSYDVLLEVEKKIMNIEDMIPHRLQVVISPDGLSIRTKVTHEQRDTMLCYHIWNRLSSIRVRLHRLFIFPKDGVTESERMRHVQALGDVCRRHLLIASRFPPKLMRNHLVAYTFVNTAVASALTLIACPGVLDDSFFIPQLNRIVQSLALAQQSLSSSLARKAVALLKALINQAKSSTPFTEPPFKRHCGFHQARKTSTVQSDSDADSLEHKSVSSLYGESAPKTLKQLLESNSLEERRFVALKSQTSALSPSQLQAPDHVQHDCRALSPVSSMSTTAPGDQTVQKTPLPSSTEPHPAHPPLVNLNALDKLPFTYHIPRPLPVATAADHSPDSEECGQISQDGSQVQPNMLFSPSFLNQTANTLCHVGELSNIHTTPISSESASDHTQLPSTQSQTIREQITSNLDSRAMDKLPMANFEIPTVTKDFEAQPDNCKRMGDRSLDLLGRSCGISSEIGKNRMVEFEEESLLNPIQPNVELSSSNLTTQESSIITETGNEVLNNKESSGVGCEDWFWDLLKTG